MSAVAPYRPGLRRGPSPVRRRTPPPPGRLDRLARDVLERAARPWRAGGLESLEARVAALEALDAPARDAALARLAARARLRGHDGASLADGLAHACAAARRTLGLTPHASQRRAAHALLRGRFVELPTGEGKSLATALAAAVAALDGTPVHVLTVNDYLGARDARALAPLYAALGLSSACALPDMDDAARRAAYACDVVHATAKQVGFDRMRDALANGPGGGAGGGAGGGPDPASLAARLGELTRVGGDRAPAPSLLRGLCRAFVDEADALLIDEARVPLVLAAPAATGAPVAGDAAVALGLARLLREGIDYRLEETTRSVRLSAAGLAALEAGGERIAGVWRAPRYRDERVRQALAALHLWRRDRDYVVRDGRVELVDAGTGRALPDRRLSHGLHGLLEAKERCAPTVESETVAALPFQRLFRSYASLAGTSGTLAEVAGELARTYGATLERVAPATPSRLTALPARVLSGRAAQLDALVAEVRRAAAAGRPTLVGTTSVADSAAVSALLAAHDIDHVRLDAAQDADEARTVAEAGLAGRVTVATNMAGRGTDIPLGPGVAEAGGLHVVALGFNPARRLDRQLAGRAARQGEPGSWRRLTRLDDPALLAELPAAVVGSARAALCKFHRRAAGQENGGPAATGPVERLQEHLANGVALLLVRAAQRRIERRHVRERRAALDAADRLARHLAVGGRHEL